ncbi:hypothetical protein CEXT_539481 [Caerostris extrusa]|uniref:Uncharacterized protein n=1 Tax=Caerostris extrusa TaxID=172846 RepID=A0AAV4RK70_CAEEX|nr:hypothetical protein CEXT_539481 [Caerostris extrusa]
MKNITDLPSKNSLLEGGEKNTIPTPQTSSSLFSDIKKNILAHDGRNSFSKRKDEIEGRLLKSSNSDTGRKSDVTPRRTTKKKKQHFYMATLSSKQDCARRNTKLRIKLFSAGSDIRKLGGAQKY